MYSYHDPTSVMFLSHFFCLSLLPQALTNLLLSSSLHLSTSFSATNGGETVAHVIYIHMPINSSASRVVP